LNSSSLSSEEEGAVGASYCVRIQLYLSRDNTGSEKWVDVAHTDWVTPIPVVVAASAAEGEDEANVVGEGEGGGGDGNVEGQLLQIEGLIRKYSTTTAATASPEKGEYDNKRHHSRPTTSSVNDEKSRPKNSNENAAGVDIDTDAYDIQKQQRQGHITGNGNENEIVQWLRRRADKIRNSHSSDNRKRIAVTATATSTLVDVAVVKDKDGVGNDVASSSSEEANVVVEAAINEEL
jgi:hypothetical protein